VCGKSGGSGGAKAGEINLEASWRPALVIMGHVELLPCRSLKLPIGQHQIRSASLEVDETVLSLPSTRFTRLDTLLAFIVWSLGLRFLYEHLSSIYIKWDRKLDKCTQRMY
jgi:hypothetical protein